MRGCLRAVFLVNCRECAETTCQSEEVHYPESRMIRLVQDNLNTHDGGSLYKTFPPRWSGGLDDGRTRVTAWKG